MQAGGPGKMRDIETEELIEDQQQVRLSHHSHQTIFFNLQRIRELEASNTGLREKLMVAKQQLVGAGSRPPAARRSPARRQVRWWWWWWW